MAGKPQTSRSMTRHSRSWGSSWSGPSLSPPPAPCAARTSCRQPAGRPHHQSHLWPAEPFAHTYRGHGTDRARRGILGLDTDDENIKQAFDSRAGPEYHFDIIT